MEIYGKMWDLTWEKKGKMKDEGYLVAHATDPKWVSSPQLEVDKNPTSPSQKSGLN